MQVIPILQSLLWLSVIYLVQTKILVIRKPLIALDPHVTSSALLQQLCLSEQSSLEVPPCKWVTLTTACSSLFSVVVPTLWISLLKEVRKGSRTCHFAERARKKCSGGPFYEGVRTVVYGNSSRGCFYKGLRLKSIVCIILLLLYCLLPS